MKSDAWGTADSGKEPQGGFNFDLEKIQHALNSPTISFPRGMNGEQRRAFLRERLNEMDMQAKPEPLA